MIAAEQMSRFLQALKEPIARNAVAYVKANHPAWLARLTVREGARVRHRIGQPGGGYDRNITRTSTLRSMIEYLHGNPVRRGLVPRPRIGNGQVTVSELLAQNNIANTIQQQLAIDIEVGKEASGVLYALGGASGGLTLYMDKGQLVYEYNIMIIERYIAKSEGKIAPGKHKIEVDTTIARPGAPADVVLKVDGKEVARLYA
jgi:hypothetical protein